jgi:integrase
MTHWRTPGNSMLDSDKYGNAGQRRISSSKDGCRSMSAMSPLATEIAWRWNMSRRAKTLAVFTTAGFARLIERAGESAKLGFKAHPHMLRHACGFALANKGHDTRAYLGHRNIQHTVRYTELAPDRFKDFWR